MTSGKRVVTTPLIREIAPGLSLILFRGKPVAIRRYVERRYGHGYEVASLVPSPPNAYASPGNRVPGPWRISL